MCKQSDRLSADYEAGRINVADYVAGMQNLSTAKRVTAKRRSDDIILTMLPALIVLMVALFVVIPFTK